MNRKLTELTEDELDQIAGGGGRYYLPSKDGGKPDVWGGKPSVLPNDDIDGNYWGPSWGES